MLCISTCILNTKPRTLTDLDQECKTIAGKKVDKFYLLYPYYECAKAFGRLL